MQDGYVVVQPTYVWANASQYPLPVPIDEGDITRPFVLLTVQGLWYSIFSQKINPLVFLIGIADHAWPLVMHRTE
jgi:hypothetical protein